MRHIFIFTSLLLVACTSNNIEEELNLLDQLNKEDKLYFKLLDAKNYYPSLEEELYIDNVKLLIDGKQGE